MKTRTFYDLNHAKQYLNNSIIRVGDEPILIHDIVLGPAIIYFPLTKVTAPEKIMLNHVSINMVPVQLGWVNYSLPFHKGHVLIKTFRKPKRMWKIGLSIDNLSIYPDIVEHMILLRSAGFTNTIKGYYPSIEQAIQAPIPLAFSRSFAIDENKKLNYLLLDEPVGEVFKNTVQLFPPFFYLSELLGQEMAGKYAA